MDTTILDYEHEVTNKIKQNADNPDFPSMSDYHLTQKMIDDYLFDKQAILDSKGSEKSQYTIAGILIVLPIVVLSLFPDDKMPWGKWSVFVGVVIGVILSLLEKLVMKYVIKIRLHKMRDEVIEHYIDDVLNY